MDPDETLASIFIHLHCGETYEAVQAMDNLKNWLDREGFPPDVGEAMQRFYNRYEEDLEPHIVEKS